MSEVSPPAPSRQPVGLFGKKLIAVILLMSLAAGASIILARSRAPAENMENQDNIQTPAGDFSISATGGSIRFTKGQYAEVISQDYRYIRLENLTENYSKVVSLDYSPKGNWLNVSFSPASGTPTFESTATVAIDTGLLPENMGSFQLLVTGASSDGVSHSASIQVTIQ
ncbi:MAG: hypothetical protein AB1476_05830 [Candidatus Hadarchaeota archaeon]